MAIHYPCWGSIHYFVVSQVKRVTGAGRGSRQRHTDDRTEQDGNVTRQCSPVRWIHSIIISIQITSCAYLFTFIQLNWTEPACLEVVLVFGSMLDSIIVMYRDVPWLIIQFICIYDYLCCFVLIILTLHPIFLLSFSITLPLLPII